MPLRLPSLRGSDGSPLQRGPSQPAPRSGIASEPMLPRRRGMGACMAISGNARGAALMVGAMAAFTLNDAMMKLVLAELPFGQAVFLRSLGVLLGLLALSRWLGPVRLNVSRADGRMLALRSVAEIVTVTLYLHALRFMPLPNATAIMQALPLVLTLAGALFFGERIGWRRLLAIAVGFAGVMIIVRPGSEGFGWPALLAVAAVGAVAVRELATRRLSPAVGAMTAACSMAAAVMVASGILMLFEGWEPLRTEISVQLGIAVVGIAFGYMLGVGAMREGEIAVVSPFRYTGLLWSLLFGWAVFGYFPDAVSLLGAAVIAGAGLFTFYREVVVPGRAAALPARD